MPVPDAVQLVHIAIEKNREIPAVLDAYGEFIDSPIGPLELQNLSEVFARILDNLSQRFPETASKRAASAAQSDITAFLAATNSNSDRLKEIMRSELGSVSSAMIQSIAERFRRMNTEERKAIDATLRIIRRSRVELLFKADMGKQMASRDKDFQRYFALIKSQAEGMKELRYENLIVEKAIFNRLILKSKMQDYFIWVPSFFVKAETDKLIEKIGLVSEHLMLARLEDLQSQNKLSEFRPFFLELEENLGALPKENQVPAEFSDLFQVVGDYQVLRPIELDDISDYFRKEADAASALLAENDRRKLENERLRIEQERKTQEATRKTRPTVIQVAAAESETRANDKNSVYLGKKVDFEQFVSALKRRVSEKDFPNEVKEIGDFYIEAGIRDIAIVGSSGSGRSATAKRVLDGIAAKPKAPKIFVIDQKGEHRGIAWKYKWTVFAFAKDSQARELKISLSSKSEEDSGLLSDLIQEWFLQSGVPCTDQQKERIGSNIRSLSGGATSLDGVADAMIKESELSQLGQKLKRNLGPKSNLSRVLSNEARAPVDESSTLFDISGRGMKDPTTKEDRQFLSVLLLRDLAESGIRDSIVMIEDVLDRFKVESLKSRTIKIVQKLRANGNKVIIASKSQTREFLASDCQELLHRLFGEKVVTEELAQFDTNISRESLANMVGFLPRGYLITSRVKSSSGAGLSAAVKVEQIQFAKVEI